jgi:hypothetical protein
LFTWLSFGSALPAKVAQFSVGANTQEASANCFGYEAHGVMRRPRREAQ